MKILFCSDALMPRQPDSLYRSEAQAADQLDIEYYLIDFEALVNERSVERAVRYVPVHNEPIVAIYRGWMLKPELYGLLYQALLKRGVRLINDLKAYRHCHYLPESYPIIAGYTPESVWLPCGPRIVMDEIAHALKPFGEKPVIVKDYVKSQKHYWNEACFIPSASDMSAVERVVQRFLELQGDGLNEGLVFREYVELEPLATHSKSGMPLTTEYRIFFLDGTPVFAAEYWEEGSYSNKRVPDGLFKDVAQRIRSCFFTMDVARRLNGDWIIVELGDGQVAGLPTNADPLGFIGAVLSHVETARG